ncbi:hypothetical protein N866_14125 [Actinotalea ferrariae CF5-4]|uniref:Uncharacterized protein n=1 Tax=Actinotalea ferrariae CF5-4 TaxID=948458 RepID=A0A021VPG4_9CELL|nr:DUF6177 family protein [Actinotalea ferrariae]EYR61925.1 hypothetical protein N866_14125 [Actinotalea ferrariae CF5-4]
MTAAASAPHPAVDASNGHGVLTETRAEVAYLSEARADLLLQASAARRPVVLVSDEVTRLTYPLREALRDAGGHWVVRATDGTLRDGFDGRRLARVADAVSGERVGSADDVAVRFLRPQRAEAVQLLLSQSVRHKAAPTTVLGGTAELLTQELTGAPPRGWGAHEPAVVAWDRTRLTELARGRMPRETTVMVAGSPERPVIGTIRTARTEHGLEETTQLLVAVGAPGSDEARAVVDRLPQVMAAFGAQQLPLFGLVLARTGRRDLTFPSVLEAPPTPLGMLVGPPGVRDLGLDVRDLGDRLGARVVGRPRVPGLYFPLGTFTEPGWAALDAVLDALGRDRVRAVLGQAGGPWEGVLGG